MVRVNMNITIDNVYDISSVYLDAMDELREYLADVYCVNLSDIQIVVVGHDNLSTYTKV